MILTQSFLCFPFFSIIVMKQLLFISVAILTVQQASSRHSHRSSLEGFDKHMKLMKHRPKCGSCNEEWSQCLRCPELVKAMKKVQKKLKASPDGEFKNKAHMLQKLEIGLASDVYTTCWTEKECARMNNNAPSHRRNELDHLLAFSAKGRSCRQKWNVKLGRDSLFLDRS